jgi:mono/diheme cytochrome c family protein
VALAPATNFGTLSGMVLIGNFGDGVINAYNPDTGAFVDSVKNSAGQPIANAGLWGIAFGNGARNQPTTTLYFAAGIANEAAGLYGRIDLGATPPDIVAPTVTLSAPAAAATVSGTTAVTATASDNVGVTSVEFFAGTASIGTATAAPFTINWDTTGTANGAVSLTAQAKDQAGNVTTSPAVDVTVSNQAPPPPMVTLAQLQSTIFTPRCSSCHTGNGAGLPGSMNLTSAAASFAALVNVTSVENAALKRVLPGQPNDSYIVHKLEGTDIGNTSRMPLGGPFLDQATIDMVRAWITQGALNN